MELMHRRTARRGGMRWRAHPRPRVEHAYRQDPRARPREARDAREDNVRPRTRHAHEEQAWVEGTRFAGMDHSDVRPSSRDCAEIEPEPSVITARPKSASAVARTLAHGVTGEMVPYLRGSAVHSGAAEPAGRRVARCTHPIVMNVCTENQKASSRRRGPSTESASDSA